MIFVMILLEDIIMSVVKMEGMENFVKNVLKKRGYNYGYFK